MRRGVGETARVRDASKISIEPMPPVAAGRLPWVRSGTALLRDPTEFFARTRRAVGDTFVVDAFGYRLFCVFSPAGVRSLYTFAEHDASFGLATYELIKLKLPPEIFDGRRNGPHHLFGSQEVERYLGNLETAVELELDRLGPSGSFEVFAEAKRLAHRMGLASWFAPEAAAPQYLERLIPMFEALDTSEAFVRPSQRLATWATRNGRERRAMRGIETITGEIRRGRDKVRRSAPDFFDQLQESWADVPQPARDVGVARDVMLIHLGSQSNLYAALAWTLLNVLRHPEYRERILDGDDTLLERCANESIRMSQRSITLRQVLRPVELTDEQCTYRIGPGAFITTMLSVNNTTAAPGLDRFDPVHYDGRRLAPSVTVPAKEMVSTFGHGTHSCPATRFRSPRSAPRSSVSS